MSNESTWYGRAARRFGDVVNIGVNNATGGLLNQGIGRLMGATGDQIDHMNQDMRRNTGLGGDAAAAIGNVYGVARGLRGLGQVRAAAPAVINNVRTAAALAPTAGISTAARFLAGRAGPGLVPVAARLARPSGRALAAAGGTAAGVAGLTALGYANRQDDTVTPMTPPPVDRTEKNAIKTALAAGREAPAAVTPYDRQLAALDTILRSPNMTLSDLQAASGMLPDRGDLPSTEDTIMGETAALSRQMFESQIADITARVDAGELTPEQGQAMTATAMEGEFQRRSGLVGFNPMNLVQAQMMSRGTEGQ